MSNYLLQIFEKYFDEILFIKGKLTLSETFLVERKKQILLENRENKLLVTAIASYRDISLMGAASNLFSPNYLYEITTDNLDNEVDDIISQQSCFAVSQAYEVFETFIIEILTEFLLNNQDKFAMVKFADGSIILLRETIRDMVKKKQDTNNKGLLRMVRKVSTHFREYETKNIFSVNISHWFDMLSMIRHTLVHNRQIISNRLLNYLKEQRADQMFNQHFKRKKIGNKVCIYLQKNTALDVIHWLNTYSHLIFIALCKEANISTSVPQYIAPPRNLSRFSW